MQALLRFGEDPNSGSHEGRPLQIAVRNDDIRATELLLRAGPDDRTPNAVSSLVDIAISQANVHIARLLMEKITDINTPHDEIVKHILSRASKHHYKPPKSILGLAIRNQNVEVMDLLLNSGAEIGQGLFQELVAEVVRVNNNEIVKHLLPRANEVTLSKHPYYIDLSLALSLAIGNQNMKMIDLLLGFYWNC